MTILAEKFFNEVLEHWGDLTAIEEQLGHETIADMWYFSNALMFDQGFDVHDQEAGILVVIEELPSKEDFKAKMNFHNLNEKSDSTTPILKLR